jgi:hypothetical protein
VRTKKSKALQAPVVSNEELLGLLRRITTEQQVTIHGLKKMMSGNAKSDKIVASIKALQSVGLRNSTLAKFSNIALGQVFQFFKENWEDLPEKFTQAYTEGHYGYIQQVYGLGSEMADMYAKVWVAFYSGQHKFKLPEYVRLGALPVTKMNTAASYILRNEMTPTRWKVLADETLSMSELAMGMRNADNDDDEERPARGPKPSSSRSSVSKETGDIRMYIDGQTEQVGFLNMNSANHAVLDEIRRICKDGKIKVVR